MFDVLGDAGALVVLVEAALVQKAIPPDGRRAGEEQANVLRLSPVGVVHPEILELTAEILVPQAMVQESHHTG